MPVLNVSFVGAEEGDWLVTSADTIVGLPLPEARFVTRIVDRPAPDPLCAWHLRSFTSNLRYTTAAEAKTLAVRQDPLGRAGSLRGALIPIKKSDAWWNLGQDERRAIYEDRSRHTSIGLEYLPRIARQLHHSRDLGEPFDFLTWFEFAEEDAGAFDELVGRLRATEEWDYVEREIDLRLQKLTA